MKDVLRCVLLPIQNDMLLVPYAAIAEVIPFEKPEPLSKASSASILGLVNWRKIKIPLVNLNNFNTTSNNAPESKEESNKESKENSTMIESPVKNIHVAVLNRMTENGPDFIGILLQGIPRMGRFRPTDIESNQTASIKPYRLINVKIRAEEATIPDLAKIEEEVKKSII